MRIETLARRPELQNLPEDSVRVVRALRRWVAARQGGACGMAALREQLGCIRAAAHLHLLLEEVGAAWPEPFALSPPCCPRLSHDEATLGEMLLLAGSGDRAAFDRLLGDLLPEEIRERLFLSSRLVVELLPA